MAVAQFERSIIQERVRAGLRVARARGVKLGRRETISRHQAAVSQLVASGHGTRGIAGELGLSPASAHKLVTLARLGLECQRPGPGCPAGVEGQEPDCEAAEGTGASHP